MKENIERRSLVQRVFPPISKEEDVKTFSWQRAKRGAKIGAAIGAGTTVAFITAGALITNTKIELKDIAPIARTTIQSALFWGTVGAGLDGFKPTSRMVRLGYGLERVIVKETSQVIKKLKNKPSGDNTSDVI